MIISLSFVCLFVLFFLENLVCWATENEKKGDDLKCDMVDC